MSLALESVRPVPITQIAILAMLQMRRQESLKCSITTEPLLITAMIHAQLLVLPTKMAILALTAILPAKPAQEALPISVPHVFQEDISSEEILVSPIVQLKAPSTRQSPKEMFVSLVIAVVSHVKMCQRNVLLVTLRTNTDMALIATLSVPPPQLM